jgi:transcriptional regulator with XRE-family HTH domain
MVSAVANRACGVGADLRALRKARGLTLSELALKFFGPNNAPEDERGYVVRWNSRRALGSAEQGLVEQLLSPDLSGSFEIVRSVFEPGAELPEFNQRATEEAGYLIPEARRQFPLQGRAPSLAQPGRPARHRNLGHRAPCVLRITSWQTFQQPPAWSSSAAVSSAHRRCIIWR